MILQIPRDFQSYPCFRNLMIEVGNEIDATFLFFKLWVELGYQCDLHEQPGYFDRGCIEAFNASMKKFDGKAGLLCLLAAKVITPHKDEGDYICPMFMKVNQQLCGDTLPPAERAEMVGRFNRKKHVARENTESVAKRLPEDVWMGPFGLRLTLEEMKRCITLIKIVDSVVAQKARQKFEFTLGIIHDAHRVNSRFSDTQTEIILKRLFFVRRQKVVTLPRFAAQVLSRWDDILYQIMPDDGFLNWDKAYEPSATKTQPQPATD